MVAVEGLTHIVRYINPAFCALVGKNKCDLLELPFAKAVPEGNQNGCLDLLERVFRTGQSEVLEEQAHGLKEGCFWSYSFWAILDLNEQPVGVMIQITDTSEAAAFRKRSVDVNEALVLSSIRQHELTSTALELNKELVAATEIKNQFLAAMSHEIRTPLNAIMGFSELLALSDQTADERYVYGERMKRNAVLLLRLINDLLDLSKVESGKLLIEKIDTNLPELFSDVGMVMSHLAEEKGVSFFMNCTNILPDFVTTDPTRFKQILINVVGNAVKFTSEASVRLVTSVDQVSKKCCITVTDTGEGMSSEQSAKIFYPFMQGDATTTRKFGGTGLGLDLAKRLAKALGGDVILLESSPGKGSAFEITFALENPRYKGQVKAPERKSKEKYPPLNGIRVLLAEDAPDNQLLMTKFLNLAGASVFLASDGEEVVSKSLSGHFDIILMDI
jgi:signal transduction histidine kinase